MATALEWLAFAIGLLLVALTVGSLINTIITPRTISSRITYLLWLVVYRTFLFVANRMSRYESKDRLLAYLAPVSLLVTLAGWLLLFLLGYALMFWPLIPGGFGAALQLSGSSLFTLGVASSPRAGPISLEFIAAATGIITVALQIGYLPTIYGAYNRRESLVTALSGRAGAPAWGPEILARHQLSRSVATLPALYAAWETWADRHGGVTCQLSLADDLPLTRSAALLGDKPAGGDGFGGALRRPGPVMCRRKRGSACAWGISAFSRWHG